MIIKTIIKINEIKEKRIKTKVSKIKKPFVLKLKKWWFQKLFLFSGRKKIILLDD